jgi:hypothetical protein
MFTITDSHTVLTADQFKLIHTFRTATNLRDCVPWDHGKIHNATELGADIQFTDVEV